MELPSRFRPFAMWPTAIVVYAVSILSTFSATSVFALDEITIRLDTTAATKPVSGRLFVFFATGDRGEPRMGPNWFGPEPFFACDVKNFAADETRTIDDSAEGYPTKLDKLKPGKYRVQAVLHQDRDCPFPGSGVGNPYSDVQEVTIDSELKSLDLVLNQVVVESAFPESSWRREIAQESRLLSDFHKRSIVERFVVVLPDDYQQEPERRYPVIYSIPGFGGSHRDALRLRSAPKADETGVKFIRVYLSGRCEWGHHVFADSAVNGPRGAALVKETIPHIDKTFRTIADSSARFITGHSSGGWSSLWLQVKYPDVFGGVWSLAPDPVDFRDFQCVELYAAPLQSLYLESSGERRPLARRGEKPILWFDDFTKMDDAIGRGGQLRSFEAVFSPLDDRGTPRRMYDRRTGKVDPTVAEAWRAFDINLIIQRDWKSLEPRLREKLHIVTGDLDTFYLNGAVALLKETLEKLGSDAQVEIIPGADHGSFVTADFRKKVLREMSELFLRTHSQGNGESPR